MLLALYTKRFSINRIFRLLTEKEIQVMSSQNRSARSEEKLLQPKAFRARRGEKLRRGFQRQHMAKYNVFVLSSEADLTSRNQNSSIFS